MPPKVLPKVTGRRLFKRKAVHETSAPAKMPAGIMNMFATECSRPNVTKAEMGSQMATALPVASLAIDARYTAIHTSQLQRMPRTKAVSKGKEVLATARVTVAPPCAMVPERMANLAKPTAPMRLPNLSCPVVNQGGQSCLGLTWVDHKPCMGVGYPVLATFTQTLSHQTIGFNMLRPLRTSCVFPVKGPLLFMFRLL